MRGRSPQNQKSKIENDDEVVLARLAALTPLEYDRVRKSEANKLRVRVEVLDSEVLKRRETEYDAKANKVEFSVIEPWPEPVKLSEVLDEAYGRFTRFIAMPVGGPTATTLWGAHSHAVDAFVQSPRLNLCSAESGSGKTTTFDVLAPMVPRALRTENLKPAILFRVVEKHRPTLLLDEVDTYLSPDLELCGLLNAGHKRGSHAYRCEGDNRTVRAFNAHCPCVLAGVGDLPPTLRDRSIVIPLVAAPEGKLPVPFDPLDIKAETLLARKIARWVKDNFAALESCDNPRVHGP